jgi:hypothetical protein
MRAILTLRQQVQNQQALRPRTGIGIPKQRADGASRHPRARRFSLLDRLVCQQTEASPSAGRCVSCNGLRAVLKWIRGWPKGIAPAGRSARSLITSLPEEFPNGLPWHRVESWGELSSVPRGHSGKPLTSRLSRCGKNLFRGVGIKREPAQSGGRNLVLNSPQTFLRRCCSP